MEPTDLKSPSPNDAELEAWLRANSALPPLPDDGFSRGVLATLPSASRWRAQRSGWCLVAAILGSVVALAGVLASGQAAADELFVSLDHSLMAPPALVALTVAAGSVWFAFRDRLRLRLR